VSEFSRRHSERYLETAGADGYDWNGTTILLLSTIGRRSGRTYRHPLIYRDWEDSYLIVASKEGSDTPPGWYLNLHTNPDTTVQIKDKTATVQARDATAAERPAMWAYMVDVWPDYRAYQAKTTREIPVVVLERC
jgi:deazaflavin-dependent oxidoreductase (nitroreductase family)